MTEPAVRGTFWAGLLQSLAIYAVGALLVIAVMAIPASGNLFWLVPFVAFGASLWLAVWHANHGRPRTARGVYTGTVIFLLLVLIGILALFAYAFRNFNVHIHPQ